MPTQIWFHLLQQSWLTGTIIFALATTIPSLRHHEPGSHFQYVVLYTSIALVTIGFGGVRSTITTFGANQFDKPEQQHIFFNWFIFTVYISSVVGAIGPVYIEDTVSWALGFGICAVVNFIAVVTILLGYWFYRCETPQGSAFLDLARVFVATTRAALIIDGDLESDGLIAKPWRLCTVQQVEDFKTVIGILPLWTSSIFLATTIAIQNSLNVLQFFATDRSLGLGFHFRIPPDSLNVIALISTFTVLIFLNRLQWPSWQKLTGKFLTPLQRIGVSHVFNFLGMVPLLNQRG